MLVTLTVTEPDTVAPAEGETIARVGVGVGVGVGPLLTVIETEAVASTVPVVSWCASTVRVWAPLATVVEFQMIC